MAPSIDVVGTHVSNGIHKLNSEVTAWQQPGPAAADFRSDITTTSTPAMLSAIVNAGLNDGWSGNGAAGFEAHMAQLCGREAALFMVSSTMGNQVALRTHFGRPPLGIICDERSHVIHQEAAGVAQFSGALPQTVRPSNGLYLTLEDIRRKIVLSDGSDACTTPTRAIHLENPLGGIIMPLTELRRIKQYASENDIKLHMDGARLWEAAAAGAGSLADFCAEADSVNLCLTKGIGAPVGSIVVGDMAFIHHARWVRKSIGGAMRQPGLMAAAAWAAVDEAFGHDSSGRHSLLVRSHELAAKVAAFWQRLGGRLVAPQQTNMLWLDLEAVGIDETEWERRGKKYGLELHASRLVMHYQISDGAVERLETFMRDSMTDVGERRPDHASFPRNDAVSRLAASMREPIEIASWSTARVKGETS
ncbi:putative low-specificity L-threonine aldolase 1 [Trapelia coarctata]|nr:putative low-specificity L-threonine aldolase 1 [Trapelia coarctata]